VKGHACVAAVYRVPEDREGPFAAPGYLDRDLYQPQPPISKTKSRAGKATTK
jgi:hypothetical protein